MSTEYTGESTRRRTYTLLTGIILLTLPCYCAGFIALALAPQPQPTNAPPPAGTTGGVNPLTPGGSTLVPLLTQTAFVFPSATSLTQLPTFTPGPAAGTFQFTPTQFIPPTRTPTPTITNTPTP